MAKIYGQLEAFVCVSEFKMYYLNHVHAQLNTLRKKNM